MMDVALPRSWRLAFEQASQDRREDLAYKEKMRRAQTVERERDERIERREQERDDVASAALAFAPLEDVAAYRAELDDYDAKTVEALMNKQEEMDRTRKASERMLAEAIVLPDGRRIFKTRDGQRVFDEHGQEVSRETVDPAGIDDKKPKWESFKAGTDTYDRLVQERQALSDYQTKLDDARERLDKGEITVQELKAMKAELKADMPDAVREKLGLEKAENGMKPAIEANAAPLPNDMDALMRQTGRGPVSTMPSNG